MYGRAAGFVAALILGVMPYHVLVSRQILLDGPMTFFATLGLYLLARYAATRRAIWVYAAAGALALSFLSKETAILLLGGVYAFFALTRSLHVRLRDLAIAMCVFILVIAPYPASMKYSGKSSTGGHFLTWQLFRRPNHAWTFYPANLFFAAGALTLVAVGARPVVAAPLVVVAGVATAVLGGGPGLVLRALGREGLPVPATDRSCARPACRSRTDEPAMGSAQAPWTAARSCSAGTCNDGRGHDNRGSEPRHPVLAPHPAGPCQHNIPRRHRRCPRWPLGRDRGWRTTCRPAHSCWLWALPWRTSSSSTVATGPTACP